MAENNIVTSWQLSVWVVYKEVKAAHMEKRLQKI